MDLFDLGGDVVFVTGAGSGIGQRIAVGVAEAGADVACLDLPGQAGCGETVERIGALGRRALRLEGDVTRPADLAEAVEQAERALGPLTGAVNAAGIGNGAPAEDMPLAQWQRMLDVNVTGVFLSCQAQARAMLPRGHGRIVNVASMSGTIVNRNVTQAHYNASKAAVVQLSRSLAMEWAPRGLRVNALSPGYTRTPMTMHDGNRDRLPEFVRDTPLGRMGTVDDLAGPAIFLLARASSFCTGVDLIVDGGFVCW